MHLNQHDIHIWPASLDLSPAEEEKALLLLSEDERERAHRFHFSIHRMRFIAARSMLRQLLSQYLNISPEKIVFSYTEFGKPYLQFPNNIDLQFNLSHSENQALYAFSLNYQIGIDIEKIQHFALAVAERYFHPHEIQYLNQSNQAEQEQIFYRIWSKKEAIIKAIGHGLSIPLASFVVSTQEEQETIMINNEVWSLLPVQLPDYQTGYQAALATNQPLELINIVYGKK